MNEICLRLPLDVYHRLRVISIKRGVSLPHLLAVAIPGAPAIRVLPQQSLKELRDWQQRAKRLLLAPNGSDPTLVPRAISVAEQVLHLQAHLSSVPHGALEDQAPMQEAGDEVKWRNRSASGDLLRRLKSVLLSGDHEIFDYVTTTILAAENPPKNRRRRRRVARNVRPAETVRSGTPAEPTKLEIGRLAAMLTKILESDNELAIIGSTSTISVVHWLIVLRQLVLSGAEAIDTSVVSVPNRRVHQDFQRLITALTEIPTRYTLYLRVDSKSS